MGSDFGVVKKSVVAYGFFGLVGALVVGALSVAGHPASSFMWGRTAGMLASAAVTWWLTVVAARGARWAFVRVRIICVVVPVAIVAIDIIPGTLPAWFVTLQVAGALALVPAAVAVNRSRLRAAFSK